MTGSPAAVRVYGLAQCDSCRKARKWLDRFGVAHEFIDYRAQPIAGDVLKSWAAAVGWDAIINRGSTTWRSLPPVRKQASSDAEWVLLLRDHPALLKRPVVVSDDGVPAFGFAANAYERRFGKRQAP